VVPIPGRQRPFYSGLLTVADAGCVHPVRRQTGDCCPAIRSTAIHYKRTGLFRRLREEEGRFPDTMDQRFRCDGVNSSHLFRLVLRRWQTRRVQNCPPSRRDTLFGPRRYPSWKVAPILNTSRSEFKSELTAPLNPPKTPRSRVQASNCPRNPSVPRVSDGVVLSRAQNLLKSSVGERPQLKSGTLDVEQIGKRLRKP